MSEQKWMTQLEYDSSLWPVFLKSPQKCHEFFAIHICLQFTWLFDKVPLTTQISKYDAQKVA